MARMGARPSEGGFQTLGGARECSILPSCITMSRKVNVNALPQALQTWADAVIDRNRPAIQSLDVIIAKLETKLERLNDED